MSTRFRPSFRPFSLFCKMEQGERVGLNLNRHHFATPSKFPCNTHPYRCTVWDSWLCKRSFLPLHCPNTERESEFSEKCRQNLLLSPHTVKTAKLRFETNWFIFVTVKVNANIHSPTATAAAAVAAPDRREASM